MVELYVQNVSCVGSKVTNIAFVSGGHIENSAKFVLGTLFKWADFVVPLHFQAQI